MFFQHVTQHRILTHCVEVVIRLASFGPSHRRHILEGLVVNIEFHLPAETTKYLIYRWSFTQVKLL